jgi:hypothetical protein
MAHFGDLVPSIDDGYPDHPYPRILLESETYRDLDYAHGEIRSLAEQLAAMARTATTRL